MTDDARLYQRVGKAIASHDRINHSKEIYGRGHVHTNTIEGFFSVFKRGMNGVLPALLRGSPAAASHGVRLPLQPPLKPGRRRRAESGGCPARHRGQAADLQKH